jgi:hypothetical protein
MAFAAGRWMSTGGTKSDQPSVTNAAAVPAVSAVAGVRNAALATGSLPRADFSTAEGFQAYVRRLVQETGVSEEFAQWLGLTALARTNFDGAFQIAKAEKLIGIWSTGAALANPTAAWAAARTLPVQEREQALYGLMMALGRTDPQGGFALLSSLPPIEAQGAAFGFFEAWANLSVDAAAQAAAKMQPHSLRNRALSGVFHVWGLQDRRGMMEWASTQDPAIGRRAFGACYEMAGVRDPAAMLELAQEYPKTTNWGIVPEIARALVAGGASGLDAISQLPPGLLRSQLMMRAGSAMAADDPAGAWKALQALSPEDQSCFLRLSADALAKVAPREIGEMFLGGLMGSEYLSSVMREWSKSDAPAALAWASSHLQGRVKLDSLSAVMRQWASTDPSAAMGALQALPPGSRARLLPSAAQAWASTAPEDAFNWAKSLTPQDRIAATDAVMKGWANRDPSAAAKMLLETPAAGLQSSFDAVANNLTQRQPAAGFQWAGNLSDVGMRNREIGNAAETWGRLDASAAADQLAEMKPGELRDSAVGGFVRSISALDPATAAGWADSIQNQDRRASSVKSVLGSWRSQDREAARAFVNAMAPGPLKEQMRQFVEK